MNNQTPANTATYEEAIAWLYDRIDYERMRPAGQSNPFRLERTERLLQRIGSPHLKIPVVHIAGTKGKGSTAALIDSILKASEIRCGLFTSPHVEQFEERMRVRGRMPSPDQLVSLVTRLRTVLQDAERDSGDRTPTFFEVTTLLAWMYFDEENCDIVVLETGLGGRLDCTNVCRPLVTVITSIGLDHTHILGDTVSKIAAEKAGIIKADIPLVQGQVPGDADRVISVRAEEMRAPRYLCGRDFAWHSDFVDSGSPRTQKVLVVTPQNRYEELELPLLGEHQAHNASLAVMACELLQNAGFRSIGPESIRAGVQQLRWPLRFEVIEGAPPTILDAAHNPDAMTAVCRVLDSPEWRNRVRVLVFAASSDKDAAGMMKIILPQFDHVILTRFLGNPRAIAAETLLTLAAGLISDSKSGPLLQTCDGPAEALMLAEELAGNAGMICVTGSLFLAAEARGLLLSRAKEQGSVAGSEPDPPHPEIPLNRKKDGLS